MSALAAVLRKELVDAFRDRRTVVTALVVMPLALPALFGGLGVVGARAQARKLEGPLRVPVEHAERAPNLVAFLREGGVEAEPAPADPERLVREHDADLFVRIDPSFESKWRASEPAPVELVYDASRPLESGAPVARVRRLLEAYGEQVGALRLVARGVNPAAAKPLRLAERDLAPPGSRFDFARQFVPYLLMLYGFIGGMQIAIDATAGERERQSLEPLLATPARREAILSGKLLATAAFAQLTLVVMLAAFKLVFAALPLAGGEASFQLPLAALPRLWLAITPVTLLGAGVLTSLAAFAESAREAQSYLASLMLLPMLPSLFLMVSPAKAKLWAMALPFFGPNQLIVKILRGEAVSAAEWALCLGSGVALAALVWALAARLYHRESLAVSG
ncbi:MAG TPA: ABC transporter permease [Polyangiaceae bacterium]|nr:ABC transporter permease [Polyangiaceae bacterium]